MRWLWLALWMSAERVVLRIGEWILDWWMNAEAVT